MKEERIWNDSEDFKGAVRQWADRIGVQVREIHLRDMRRKWASISLNGRLTLNTDLVNLPKALGEYVIVHELVHLLAPNHGALFKSYMSAYLPDWQDRQRALQTLPDLPSKSSPLVSLLLPTSQVIWTVSVFLRLLFD